MATKGKVNHPSFPTIADYRLLPPHPNRIEGGRRLSDERDEKPAQDLPLASVVTIVRNGEDWLEKTILSVLDQSYDNIEYVIVDGASTDGTVNIIRRYEQKIAYWLSEPDKGISDAFNKGIALCRGDLVGIINAGDWYNQDTVRDAVGQYRESGADVIFGNLQIWEGSSNVKSHTIAAREDLLLRRMALNHPTVFVTRAAYRKIGIFRRDFSYAMDYEWLLRAKLAGLKFSHIHKCLANMPSGGASSQNWLQTRWEGARAKNIHFPGKANYLYFAYQILSALLRRVLEFAGLRRFVRYLQERYQL